MPSGIVYSHTCNATTLTNIWTRVSPPAWPHQITNPPHTRKLAYVDKSYPRQFLCHWSSEMNLSPSPTPTSASAQLVHTFYTICKMISRQGSEWWEFETIIYADALSSIVSYIGWKIARLIPHANCNQKHHACTNKDRDNTISTHSGCKKLKNISRAHFETTTLRVLRRGNVRSRTATTVKSFGIPIYRLAIAWMVIVQTFQIFMQNITPNYWLVQSFFVDFLSVLYINYTLLIVVCASTSPPSTNLLWFA